jgi:hypothetical protein
MSTHDFRSIDASFSTIIEAVSTSVATWFKGTSCEQGGALHLVSFTRACSSSIAFSSQRVHGLRCSRNCALCWRVDSSFNLIRCSAVSDPPHNNFSNPASRAVACPPSPFRHAASTDQAEPRSVRPHLGAAIAAPTGA